jgi:hypothetical protein
LFIRDKKRHGVKFSFDHCQKGMGSNLPLSIVLKIYSSEIPAVQTTNDSLKFYLHIKV